MQEYLSAVEASLILDKEDKTELCILFVNCLEVKLLCQSLSFMVLYRRYHEPIGTFLKY